MKTNTLPILFLAAILLILAQSCKEEIDYDSMIVYQPQELAKIIDNAVKIETAGAPVVTRTEQDSSIITTTTQVYRVYIILGDDNHILENPDSTVIALRPATGPIIITTSCNMVCTPVRPGEACNISGCTETKRCGCSQGSCGNNCTTDTACHMDRSGFSFGATIIF